MDYDSLCKLARNGASVIYPECLPLLKKHDVPLVVDNTFAPAVANTTVTHKQSPHPFFSITYDFQPNITKHTATVMLLYHKISFDVGDLGKLMSDLDVYLTGFKQRGSGGGCVTLLSCARDLETVVNRLHGFLIKEKHG